ncbi:sigma 54-interacting transcriptional regulator [Neotabrizicola sp. sgz301269]|uniref:sigma 54-interacting transcriptional regulator n=1 Tax=Neotabrizicola sp. sgz301269 TaxID=3276282 RepID=UPI0037701425
MVAVVTRALAARATRTEVGRLQQVLAETAATTILGQSRALRSLRDRIAALAPLEVDVLITDETGTGKELVARALHAASPRATGPFVAVNCAALPEQMFETLMFGHAAGAFPGAGAARQGKMEAAQGGTLLLDEVETMPPALQAKLLRALQERAVERLGENDLRPLDLCIIATSKAPLREADGFRPDLFFRLAGAELATPPLRDAAEDIPLIFTHYAQLAARRYGRPDPQAGYPLHQALKRRAWPGNMRELRAAAEAHTLGLLELRADNAPVLPDNSLADRVAAFEAREIAAALERHRGNTLRVAESLGLARRTLNDKMRRYGLTSRV